MPFHTLNEQCQSSEEKIFVEVYPNYQYVFLQNTDFWFTSDLVKHPPSIVNQ